MNCLNSIGTGINKKNSNNPFTIDFNGATYDKTASDDKYYYYYLDISGTYTIKNYFTNLYFIIIGGGGGGGRGNGAGGGEEGVGGFTVEPLVAVNLNPTN